MAGRITEIDAVRGVAILLMIVFHTVFDLAYFYNWPLNYLHGFWYYQGKASAILFMLVSGLSSSLSTHPGRRGLGVLGAGLAITVLSYVFSPAVYIRFGILHLLGTAMLLTPLTSRLDPGWLVLTGTAIIAAGSLLSSWTIATPLLIPLGIIPADFASLDYYPLFPWLGVVLYGQAAGKWLYPARRALWPASSHSQGMRLLAYLGTHSLMIYLVHQPLLLGLLALL